MKLKGRVAIITGAGRGIGKAIAHAYAREGADVVAAARTFSEVKETCSQVAALGRRALPLRVDVSRVEEVDHMVEAALSEFGKVDILVNNAGVLGPVGPLYENDVDEWVEAVNVNLFGTFLCCRAVIPFMVRQRSGKIINLSGGGAAYPKPMFSAYACSKASVVRLTEVLAEEVKEFNVQVNAMAPGPVKTRIQERILEAGEKAGLRTLKEAEEVIKGGGTSAESAAELAVFLASDESDGLTGRLISAVWDDWRNMTKERIEEIMSKDLYTLRRIDNVFFAPTQRQSKKR
jgi:3-oxoacyl-[acyl-carrier protein] reductase